MSDFASLWTHASTWCPNRCRLSTIPLVFEESRLLPSFPGKCLHGPPFLLYFPQPAACSTWGTLGLNIKLPSGYDIPKPTALASMSYTDPSLTFPLVLTQAWKKKKKKGENYNREKLKTQYFCSNFPGPWCDLYASLHSCSEARATVQIRFVRVPRSLRSR